MEFEEGLWSSVRSLSNVVEAALLDRRPGIKFDLEVALRRHRPHFIGLLKNPVRSASDADLVRKAQTDGIRIPRQPLQDAAATSEGASRDTLEKLPAQVVEEALILSEMFNLNEISSLQLLFKGEEQLCQHPGLTRGLVSVLLYYDGRKSLVQSLRTLMQARDGVSWTLEIPEDVSELVTTFTDQLMEEGLVDKILNLLTELDWSKEVVTLQKNMALGNAKHRRQVHDLFHDIRQALADCIFCHAAQSGLSKADTLRLIGFMSKIRPSEATGSGTLDNVTLTLLMTLLYAVDTSSFLKTEDGDRSSADLPILKDRSFITSMHRELGPTGSSKSWEDSSLQAVAQFAWAMAIATLRALPQSMDFQSVVDDDEMTMDCALENKVFHALPNYVIGHDLMKKEEFYIRRLHQLLTDLVVQMPLKVKELRNRADDAARNTLMFEQEGIHYTAPLQSQHFEMLLTTITALYERDELGLGLDRDFWCPTETSASGQAERLPQRQVALYKFVRLAGDLLMPSLYTPYIKFLTSLSSSGQTALHCFNLLKINGMSSGVRTNQSGNASVSWDHFFHSLHQYFTNLCQETFQQSMMPIGDTIYHRTSIHRPMTRGISPAEIQGLIAVLRLIQTVCNASSSVRVAMAENSSWQPLLVIIGLLGCPVPTELKAELLRTLAAFSKSSDIADVIWENIESAQLITKPDDGTALGNFTSIVKNRQNQGGLAAELENIEAKREEYPMTLGFLDLINALTDQSMPGTLGVGTRVPGLEPYLFFIRESVLLKVNSRGYKNPEEKWKVASGCLEIFSKFLALYRPALTDFQPKKDAGVGVHPGYFIMVHMLQSSELLQTLLSILDEGCSALEAYTPFPGKIYLEKSCLFALRILEECLNQQVAFLSASKAANTSLLLTGLDQLLQGVNPRSGKPDHMLNVAKFVTFSWWLPAHTLHAVRILNFVANSASAQPGLLATLNSTDLVGKTIVKGFTEVLDASESAEEDNTESGNTLGSARIAIVQLLLNGLDKPAPSISHFLLGFDLKGIITRSTLQPPGVLGSIRTPFHSVLSLLRPSKPGFPPAALQRTPVLCEVCYKLVYHLSANPITSEPVLRYLRSSEDFLIGQLALLPLRDAMGNNGTPCNFVPITRAMSWLLKTVAVELKLVSNARMRSQVGLIIGVLLASSGETDHISNETNENVTMRNMESAVPQLSRSEVTLGQEVPSGFGMAPGGTGAQHRVIQILNSIDFLPERVETPDWDVFDTQQVLQVLKSCQRPDSVDQSTIDIQKLHSLLNNELSMLHGGAALNQRQIIQEEIRSILSHAVRVNASRDVTFAKSSFLDGWRQVTEVMLCAVPSDALSNEAKQQLLLDLLQSLLNKVLPHGAAPELTSQVSGVVLLLLASLRQTYYTARPRDSSNESSSRDELPSTSEESLHQQATPNVFSSALGVILKGLLTWIENTSTNSQRVRSNLYGALLNYLRIGKEISTSVMSSTLDISERDKFRKCNLEILLEFGDNFLDILCRDTVCGHDIRRMLALSTLDELVRLNGRGTWTYYMANQGYLRHFIEALTAEDDRLIQLICASEPDSDSLRCLYTYESKASLLARLASHAVGAELLLQAGLMVRLSEMKVFSERPDSPPSAVDLDTSMEHNWTIPSQLSRYHQVLFPALRICLALLASLGSQNRSATAQVNHFIWCNEELVRSVLKPRGVWSFSHLQELALLTGILCRSVSSELVQGDIEPLDQVAVAQAGKIKRLMQALAGHFDASEEKEKQIRQHIPKRHQEQALSRLSEVVSNVSAFRRKMPNSKVQ